MARKSDSAATPPIDHEAIRELAKLLDETGLTEIALERDGVSIRVARHSGAAIGRARPIEPALAAPGTITTTGHRDPNSRGRRPAGGIRPTPHDH